ncbi:MAG TPA: glycosyl transferase family protein, partial [Sphingomicrobium sp.]|nr:glycosyl transferase family protein [Sphingomicrobium sp.]
LRVSSAELVTLIASELALFSGVGFLLFALNDLAVDCIYFGRRLWRSATVYRKYPRAFGESFASGAAEERFIAIFVPAWDESAVIAPMLRTALSRIDYSDYRIFVGYYRNDPLTAAAILGVNDPRIEPVVIEADGPTTKAHCLNHLYDALVAREVATRQSAAAVVLHDAEDVIHPLELGLFNRLIDKAALVQLPVLPLPDAGSPWIAGHYCDEFAEAHAKELIVREAVGAAIPLAGVACAIAREVPARIAAINEGQPFAGGSMTEDYELGLRVGDLGLKTIFVRMPAAPGSRALVASRGHFPPTFAEAVRQKARWLGGIALNGWDRLGWSGGWGERWMRMRDRRGPIAALLLLSGYLAALLWSQMWFAQALGAPIQVGIDPMLAKLLWINLWLLLWRIAMRMLFTTSAYGLAQGLLSVPRLVVGNMIAICAALRAVGLYLTRSPQVWDKTRHTFPKQVQA